MRNILCLGLLLIAAGLAMRWRAQEVSPTPASLSCVGARCYTWCSRNAWGRCGDGERCVGRYDTSCVAFLGAADQHLCLTDEEIVREWNGHHTSEVMVGGRWFKMSGRIDLEALRKGIAVADPTAFSTPVRAYARASSCLWDADCGDGEACAGAKSSCRGVSPGVCSRLPR